MMKIFLRRRRRRAFAIEPGLVQTNIGRHKGRLVSFINYSILGPIFGLRTLDQGCATIVFCLLAPPEDLGGLLRIVDCDNEEHSSSSGADDDCDCDPYYNASCAPKAVFATGCRQHRTSDGTSSIV